MTLILDPHPNWAAYFATRFQIPVRGGGFSFPTTHMKTKPTMEQRILNALRDDRLNGIPLDSVIVYSTMLTIAACKPSDPIAVSDVADWLKRSFLDESDIRMQMAMLSLMGLVKRVGGELFHCPGVSDEIVRQEPAA